jgi:hypothetical protein
MTLTQFRTRVRAYANDPDTGGTFGKTGVNPLSADALIDAVGAEEDKEACNFLRRHSPGFFRKTLVTATSSTQVHTWPTDFVRLLGPPVVSDDGSSLTADETVGDEVLKGTVAIIHTTQENAGPRIWVPEQGGFRLYPKVTTAGSEALLLRYEYIPDFPSTGTEAFTWPDNHSTYLVMGTSAMLRELNGQPSGHLRKKQQQLAAGLLIDLKQVDVETEQMASSFYDDQVADVSKHGVLV